MKAIVIASVLFFSLRAMSSEQKNEGEDKSAKCEFSPQNNRAEKLKIESEVKTEEKKESTRSLSI
jgi:hypothetical protein